MLKRSRGNYTPKQVKRCSQLGGEFGKEFSRLVSEAMGVKLHASYKKKPARYKRDIRVSMDEFTKDGLFDIMPGREHKSFPGFLAQTPVKDPRKLGQRLAVLSKENDLWKRMATARRAQVNQQ